MVDHGRTESTDRAAHHGMSVQFQVGSTKLGHVDLLVPSETMLEEDELPKGCTVSQEAAQEKVMVASQKSRIDRKSTRLNSSHTVISYAVFCLKKKKNS